jgi:hypothetical protein
MELATPLNLQKDSSAVKLDLDLYRGALSMPDTCGRLGISVNGGFIHCLLHNEANASMKIYPDHAFCFSCQGHLDTIALVQHVQGCDFITALRWISREAGLPEPRLDPEAENQCRFP